MLSSEHGVWIHHIPTLLMDATVQGVCTPHTPLLCIDAHCVDEEHAHAL